MIAVRTAQEASRVLRDERMSKAGELAKFECMLGCPSAFDPTFLLSKENSRHRRSYAHASAVFKLLNRVADFHES